MLELKSHEDVEAHTRADWKLLRRGLRESKTPGQKGDKLRTNDPVTYFDLALHLLSSRPIRWEMRSVPQDDEQEQREYGKAERVLTSLVYQNDVARSRRQQGRAHRAMTDSALEQGKVAVYHEARTDKDGNLTFRIDPADPTQTWERSDDEGIFQFLHEFEQDVEWAKSKAGWKTEGLGEESGKLTVHDYWEKVPNAVPGLAEYRNVVNLTRMSNLGKSFASPTTVRDVIEPELPWKVQYFNGEAFGQDQVSKGRSILEINSRQYRDKDLYLEKLDIHMDETLTSPGNAGTVGGRSGSVDPRLLAAKSGNRGVYYFDPSRGESALSFSQIPSIDRSTTLLLEQADQGIQNGGVSQFFLGNIKTEFSGVALKRLEELTLAAVGEIGVGLAFLWSELGQWMLETIKKQDLSKKKQVFSGFAASTGNMEYLYEEIGPGDLPEFLAVQAIVDVALPDDLTERISQARQAAPSSGDILSKRVINELLFAREIPDARGAADELEEQETLALPEMRMMRVYAGLKRQLKKAEKLTDADERQLQTEIIEEQLSLIRDSFQRSGRQEDPVAGQFPQNVQPTEARQ